MEACLVRLKLLLLFKKIYLFSNFLTSRIIQQNNQRPPHQPAPQGQPRHPLPRQPPPNQPGFRAQHPGIRGQRPGFNPNQNHSPNPRHSAPLQRQHRPINDTPQSAWKAQLEHLESDPALAEQNE